MPKIIAIDQGTTSSRVVVFETESGAIIDSAQRPLPQIYPENGWVEHDPQAIWHDVQTCLTAMHAKHPDAVAIGLTNQRETTVVWNRLTGQPIYNAIVWQDRRTAPQCTLLKEQGLEQDVQAKTGLLLDPYFSATKLAWILNNVPNAKAEALKGNLAFGTIDTWVLWNLTNGKVHATDYTNASRSLLFNIHTKEWDKSLLNLFDIPLSMLPTLHPSVSAYGISSLGLPVTALCGDQQAASFGQACFENGMVKITYGTGCFALMTTGQKAPVSYNRLLATPLAHEAYALEGSIFNAGTAIQWLRDEMGIIETSADIEALANGVPDSGGVVFVPAFTGLGAPYWQPQARGLISGITRNTSKAHIARAALDAQAFQTRDLLEAMRKDSNIPVHTLRVDGGMTQNNLMCQTLADVLQCTVERPKIVETTALGAAYLAGLGAGIYKSVADIAQQWQLDKRFTPKRSAAEVDSAYANWQRSIAMCRL